MSLRTNRLYGYTSPWNKASVGYKLLMSNQMLTSSNLALFQCKSNRSSQSFHCMWLLSQFCPLDILLMFAMLRKYVEVMMTSNQCSDHEYPRSKLLLQMVGSILHQKLLVNFPCLQTYGWKGTMCILSYILKNFHYYISDWFISNACNYRLALSFPELI